MNPVLEAVADSAELVAKGITSSDINSAPTGANVLRAPQNLSPLLTNLGYRDAPFWSRLTKKAGLGLATEFNLLASLFGTGENANPMEMFITDGGTPVERKSGYKSVVQAYKALGYKGSVTGTAYRTARNGTPTDLEAQEVQNTMRRVMQGLNWLAYWSRTDVTNTAGVAGYAGLDQLTTTNVIDAGGAVISKALIDRAVRGIAYQGGIAAGEYAILCSTGIGMDINNLYNTQQQLIVNNSNDRSNLVYGNLVPEIRTILGDMKIIPDFFVNPGLPYPQGTTYSASSGAKGLNVSTIFIVPMTHLAYEELLPMSKVDLGLTGDFSSFMVLEHGTLTLNAEPWVAKITNVLESVSNA